MKSARMASLLVTGVLFGVYLEGPLRAELHQPLPTTPMRRSGMRANIDF